MVYQLRAASWKAGCVWDGLVSGNHVVVHTLPRGRQSFLQLLQRPLQRWVPFTGVSQLLVSLMAEHTLEQRALEAATKRVGNRLFLKVE